AAGDLPIDASAGWPQLYLRPGADPLAALAAQVTRLGVDALELPAAIRADPQALRRALSDAVDVAAAAATAAPAGVDAGATGSVAPGSAAQSPAGVGASVPAAGPRGGRVVVVVDQLEELFTHGSTEADRLALLRTLICVTEPCGTGP